MGDRLTDADLDALIDAYGPSGWKPMPVVSGKVGQVHAALTELRELRVAVNRLAADHACSRWLSAHPEVPDE